ncbi:unnamed protein product, partial [Mesorhabditis spiculigera]
MPRSSMIKEGFALYHDELWWARQDRVVAKTKAAVEKILANRTAFFAQLAALVVGLMAMLLMCRVVAANYPTATPVEERFRDSSMLQLPRPYECPNSFIVRVCQGRSFCMPLQHVRPSRYCPYRVHQSIQLLHDRVRHDAELKFEVEYIEIPISQDMRLDQRQLRSLWEAHTKYAPAVAHATWTAALTEEGQP